MSNPRLKAEQILATAAVPADEFGEKDELEMMVDKKLDGWGIRMQLYLDLV